MHMHMHMRMCMCMHVHVHVHVVHCKPTACMHIARLHVHAHSCARYLGPSLVYGCGLDLAWLYLPAQVCAPRREAHATAHLPP